MTNVADTRVLSEAQTEAFNVEYVDDALWSLLEPTLERRLAKGQQSVLDVGGGNGRFVDRVLERFADAQATVVEPAPDLVAANQANARKTVVPTTFQDLCRAKTDRFDLIFFNWVLHHFVVDSHAATTQTQIDALIMAKEMLRPGGAVLVLENMYDGVVFDKLPGRLIYELTAHRRLAPLVSRLGANTAGVGVCFHSESGWRRLFAEAGFRTAGFMYCYPFGPSSRFIRSALHLRGASVGLFELEAGS